MRIFISTEEVGLRAEVTEPVTGLYMYIPKHLLTHDDFPKLVIECDH